jgi:hypothetical protein
MHRSRRSLAYGVKSCEPGACTVYPIESCQFRPQKFLAFQVDFGGWNNILMQFEIMVVLACITGRTLVLPPATRLYLLGDEPRLLQDFLDLDALRRYLPVLTADEFVAAVKADSSIAVDNSYHDYMKRNAFMPDWNGLNDVLLFPSEALDIRPELQTRLASPSQINRRHVTFSADSEQCDILYFPMNTEHRMFGVAECFFMFGDEKLERKARRLLRDAIRYRPEIIELAEAAINCEVLGGKTYAAMHVRRGDFQYGETQIDARQIVENTQSLLQSNQPVYLATDESDADFLGVLRDRFDLTTFHDLPEEIVANVPHHWCGIIETLICAAAPGRFIGTRLSTFSARIAILRGHLSFTKGGDSEGIDTALYYTQAPLTRTPKFGVFSKFWRTKTPPADPAVETSIPWWLSKEPLWARAYESSWADTDF